jgi:tRNA 2-thiouridine synthesizing protein E
MPTETIAGTTVEVDDEGFFADHSAWTEAMAPALAAEAGVDALTEDHWTVIKFMRTDFEEKGESPTLRRVTSQTGIPTKNLFQLFPKKPAKKMAYVAGVPKPKGCV